MGDELDKRLLYQLIVRQLVDDGYVSAAVAVSSATMTPLSSSSSSSLPFGRLHQLVLLGLQMEKEKGISTIAQDHTRKEVTGLDLDTDRERRQSPNYLLKFVTSHRNVVRCAKFTPDGKYVASGSADTSIKLLDVQKMMTSTQQRTDGGIEEVNMSRPVVRVFYDHIQPINDIDFHPTLSLMASSSRDCTIKFYDYLSSVKKGLKFIQDSHNVRSICFHPSGDFLLSGTDHPLIRLYDLNTLQAYVTPPSAENQHNSPINQVRYSSDGKLYVSAAKEGNIKIWDAVNSRVITTISGPHSGTEVTSVQFSRNCKYLLTGGKDYTCKLWETSTGRPIFTLYASAPNIPPPGFKPQQRRTQTIFSWNEDFIITSDEINHSVAIFDSRTGDLVQRLTGHTNAVRWLAASPTDPYLITCCDDSRVRFWVEEIGFKQK